MKRLTVNVAAVLAAAILLMPCQTYAVSAQYAVLMDGRTGRILYDKGADERSLIASTTKIMTALIICEQCNVLDRMRVPKEAVPGGEGGRWRWGLWQKDWSGQAYVVWQRCTRRGRESRRRQERRGGWSQA